MRSNKTTSNAVSSLKLLALGALTAVVALASAAEAAERPASRRASAVQGPYAPAEVLIQLATDLPDQMVAALAQRLRLDRIASVTFGDVTLLRWKIPDRRSVPAVIRSLEAERIVLAAQPNYLYDLQQATLSPAEEPAAVVRVSR
jgi:fervidolysin-like protein